MTRTSVLPLLALALAAGASLFPGTARPDSTVLASIDCSDSTRVVVQWTFVADPTLPVLPGQWTGWDVERRTVADCGAWERATVTPFAHTPDRTESFTFTEPPARMRTTYQYRLVMVDAQRRPLVPAPGECYDCNPMLYAACPIASAPLTHGTAFDLGWAVFVFPCTGSCFTSLDVEGAAADPLRPFAGTGTAVRLYGIPGCGTIEGCALQLDHFDVPSCDAIVPAAPATWGRLKLRYR
jgi:hypothetical protein